MRAYYQKGGSVKTSAWQRKEGKSESGGLNKKGVESYRRENPGSKLQTAVTTDPSKLKKVLRPLIDANHFVPVWKA
jgi:hypothetical protein